MASSKRKQARSRNRRKPDKDAAAPESDATPASEAVIEAKAEDPAKKSASTAKSPFSGSRPPGGRPGEPRGRTGSFARDLGQSARVSGSWLAVAIALAAAVAALYGLMEARQVSGAQESLAQQLQPLGEQLSRIEALENSPLIGALEDRIDELENAVSSLEAGLDEKLDGALVEIAALAAQSAPEAGDPNPELLARLDQLEQSLEDIRNGLDQLDDGAPESAQPGEVQEGAGTDADSDPWWGFLGRLLKISRVEGE